MTLPGGYSYLLDMPKLTNVPRVVSISNLSAYTEFFSNPNYWSYLWISPVPFRGLYDVFPAGHTTKSGHG